MREFIDKPYFLAIGNLEPRKNVVTLVRAYRRFIDNAPDSNICLVIVGQERLLAERLYDEAGDLGDRIVFTGYLDDDTLAGILHRATAFAYPSLYEGFGLPPLEAMAAGCPVVVSDIPVLAEVCGDAALRVPPTDVGAWSEALASVALDKRMRTELIDRGNRHVSRFSWARTAEIVVDALERTCPEHLGKLPDRPD